MNRIGGILIGLAALILAASGCAERQGSSGDTGETGAGTPGQSATSVIQESITFQVLSAKVPSDGLPEVTFKLVDQDGLAYSKLTIGSNAASANLRVTIAQFVSSNTTAPTHWVNYLNTTQTKNDAKPGAWTNPSVTSRTSIQPTTEGSSAFPAGTLTYNSISQIYTYKFAQDIRTITTPLTVTYSAAATHRIGMELRNLTTTEGELLGADATYDFVPSGGTPLSHEVISTNTCNSACHGKIAAHGEARFSVKYCVVCHNQNLSDPNGGDVYDMTAGNPLDFPVMIHRMHSSGILPSSIDGGQTYSIWGFSDALAQFSEVMPVMTISRSATSDQLYMRTTAATGPGGGFFPDCVKCHKEGTGAPAQAANWRTSASAQVCTSCHNNVKFDDATDPTNGLTGMSGKWVLHSGGAQANNASCAGCHATGAGVADTETAHAYAVNIRTAADRWTYTVTQVRYNAANGQLEVTYRIDDAGSTDALDPVPAVVGANYANTGTATGRQYGSREFGSYLGGSGSLNIKVAWPSWEYANDGQNAPAQLAAGVAGQTAPASAMSQSVTGTSAPTPNEGAACASNCTFTKTLTLPASAVNAYGINNLMSLSVYFDGHPAYGIQAGIGNNTCTFGVDCPTAHPRPEPRWRSVPAQSIITYWEVATNSVALTAGTQLDATLAANADKVRRWAVDTAKCQNCHSTITLHGANRSDDTQVCVTCHNNNNSDLGQRSTASLSTSGGDGKREESIGMAVMIHGIHAGGKLSPDTTVTATYAGFREKGLIIYGNGGSKNDFTAVHFPNRLSNCLVCHKPGAFELPVSPDVNPVSWRAVSAATTTTAAAGLYESQRHQFGANPATGFANNGGNLELTLTANGYVDSTSTPSGVPVTFFKTGNAVLPTGITAGNTYYIVNKGTNTVQFSTTAGGSPIAFTDAGSRGTQTSNYFTILPATYTAGSDDYKMTPTAAACVACHDSGLAKAHVISSGLGVLDKDYTQTGAPTTSLDDATYNTSYLNQYGAGFELCVLCHGPGKVADVVKMHKPQ